jgi:hypothetical protein
MRIKLPRVWNWYERNRTVIEFISGSIPNWPSSVGRIMLSGGQIIPNLPCRFFRRVSFPHDKVLFYAFPNPLRSTPSTSKISSPPPSSARTGTGRISSPTPLNRLRCAIETTSWIRDPASKSSRYDRGESFSLIGRGCDKGLSLCR